MKKEEYFKKIEQKEKFILEKREAQKRRDPENLIIEIDKKINSITEELQTVLFKKTNSRV